MNKEKSGRLAGLIMLGFFLSLSFFSCKKDGPTKAVISVVDSINRPVQGAQVILWQDTAVNKTNGVASDLRVVKTSDAAGKAEFEFQLEAFLNIDVIYNADTSRSFIRLKEHETVNKTVVISL
ncbi:MAG: hypothetical protein EYC69_05500 [Bacteroidetes bacterium]|nr:MAG: hypothetical protein EYC69_05500 [Bacteroidota bacterium]